MQSVFSKADDISHSTEINLTEDWLTLGNFRRERNPAFPWFRVSFHSSEDNVVSSPEAKNGTKKLASLEEDLHLVTSDLSDEGMNGEGNGTDADNKWLSSGISNLMVVEDMPVTEGSPKVVRARRKVLTVQETPNRSKPKYKNSVGQEMKPTVDLSSKSAEALPERPAPELLHLDVSVPQLIVDVNVPRLIGESVKVEDKTVTMQQKVVTMQHKVLTRATSPPAMRGHHRLSKFGANSMICHRQCGSPPSVQTYHQVSDSNLSHGSMPAVERVSPKSDKIRTRDAIVSYHVNGDGVAVPVKQDERLSEEGPQRKRPTTTIRKHRNKWKRGQLSLPHKKCIMKKKACQKSPVCGVVANGLTSSASTEMSINHSDSLAQDTSLLSTALPDSPAPVLLGTPASSEDSADGKLLDTSVSSKGSYLSTPKSDVTRKHSRGRKKKLSRDLKYLLIESESSWMARRAVRSCTRATNGQPEGSSQKSRTYLALKGKALQSPSAEMPQVQYAALKRKLSCKLQAPEAKRMKQDASTSPNGQTTKMDLKTLKPAGKSQSGPTYKTKGTKTLQTPKTQPKKLVKAVKKIAVAAKMHQQANPGSKVTIRKTSSKITTGAVHSLVSQKKKAIRMQLALDKKKEKTKQQQKSSVKKASAMVAPKKVPKGSVSSKGGMHLSAPVNKQLTMLVHRNTNGTNRSPEPLASDLNPQKTLCVSPRHLQLHRLAAIFPLSYDGSVCSVHNATSGRHPQAQVKSVLESEPQRKPPRLSKNGVTVKRLSKPASPGSGVGSDPKQTIKLKSMPQVVLTQLSLSDSNPTRTSVRQSECAFRYREIAVKKQDNITHIILMSNTRIKNGLSCQVMFELQTALMAAKIDSSCRLVVVTGTGSVFCSGVDLGPLSMDPKVAERTATAIRDLCKTLLTFPKLLVAAVNGAAVGLGVTILPYFDLVYASDKATFYTPYGKLGQVPEGGATFTLPSVLGYAKANGLLMEGRRLTASEAFNVGLVTEVLWPALFMEEVIPKVRAMASRPMQAMESTKALVRYHAQSKLEVTLDTECRVLVQQWSSLECRSAIRNFLQSEEIV